MIKEADTRRSDSLFAHRLAVEVARIRQSDVLGRSNPQARLLDYLVSRADNPASPKEIEIAEALGREFAYQEGDASIRVSIHRLRKKLDEFYAGHPGHGDRLSIPRGAYRLTLESCAVTIVEAPIVEAPMPDLPAPEIAIPAPRSKATPRTGRLPPLVLAALVGAFALLGLVLGTQAVWSWRTDPSRVLGRTALWHPLVGSPLKSLYLVGDQALEGGHPHVVLMGTQRAMAEMMPVIDPLLGARARSAMTGTSFLSPSAVKEDNIVFVGSFAQMGALHNVVFSRSGFLEPDSANVLTDKASGRRFASLPPPFVDHRELTSYGYLACLFGPSGNRIIVISGATDGALVQMAEVALNASLLDTLAAKGGDEFEALYGVTTLDGANVGHHLEMVRPLTPAPRG